MKAALVNFNFTPDWLKESDFDYLIYDRSDTDEWLKDFPQERIVKTQNMGNVDYDKLNFLVNFYDSLPNTFLWGKTNLFKYISKEEFDKVKDNTEFTPLLTQDHKTYADKFGTVNYYQGGMYHERADSWYLNSVAAKHVSSWQEWARRFHLPIERYVPFAPGGNYILTRENVHKYSRDYYREMASLLDYTTLPGEAHCAERSYYLMWR